MSAILEHFKPPPLASDPPAKTKYWPAPPTPSSGGILQRPTLTAHVSASSSSSQISESVQTPSSTRVSFAPLPDVTERKRRNSITLGVAARSAALRQIKERNASTGAPRTQSGPRPSGSGAPRRPQMMYAGQPRPRRPAYKDDDVVDLGEVAMDAGKKLWRVINKKSRKSSAASDSGLPESIDGTLVVGGPTVGVSGHNTEREILVRGFAVPEDILDEDEEEEEEERERDEEEEREHVHRTEDYVADMQALRIYEGAADSGETFTVDPSAVSSTAAKGAESIEPGHIHSTRRSPPPRHSPLNLTPESEASELFTSDSSSALSGITSPNTDPPRTKPYLDSSSEKNSLF